MSKVVIRIDQPAKPKPRPRGKGKHFYNPPEYTQWKQDVATELLARFPRPRFRGRVAISIKFGRKGFVVTIEDTEQGRHGQSDIDNLAGGVLDALQDAGVIDNDRNVTVLAARFDD